MVRVFPQFRSIRDEHVADNSEVLPHIVFWDFTLLTVAAFIADRPEGLDWRGVLSYLDRQFAEGAKSVCDVIGTSFVGNLPGPDLPGAGIVRQLGPRLSVFHRLMFTGNEGAASFISE
jgi:hypothetical protein